jgi:hypothetical protein
MSLNASGADQRIPVAALSAVLNTHTNGVNHNHPDAE